MYEWQVEYYLGDMLHCVIVQASTRREAKEKALRRIPESSLPILSRLTVIRYFPEWN